VTLGDPKGGGSMSGALEWPVGEEKKGGDGLCADRCVLGTRGGTGDSPCNLARKGSGQGEKKKKNDQKGRLGHLNAGWKTDTSSRRIRRGGWGRRIAKGGEEMIEC